MLMKGEFYYELLACQQIHEVTKELNMVELALCHQNRLVEDLFQALMKAKEVQSNLKHDHENLDRELARLDGRHTQCECPQKILGRERKKRQKEKSRDLTQLLTPEQKKELLKALGAI